MTESPDQAIVVEGLRMAYGAREVVHGIDISVDHGEIFGFLGPNGAGKTTTVEILEGFRKRTHGSVKVLGIDPEMADRDWKARVGLVLQDSEPEPALNVKETIDLYAGFYEQPLASAEVLSLTGLSDCARTLNRRLSGGQRRRLDLALALVGDPDLLFLDEPTTGFDPAARRAAWELLLHLRELGKTIFLTSHYLDEVEFLADRIAVINSGTIVAQGSPTNVGGRDTQASLISFRVDHELGAHADPSTLPIPLSVKSDGSVTTHAKDPFWALSQIYEWATRCGMAVFDLEVRRPTLEDTYLSLIRKDGIDAGNSST